jgi:hypothetical protein
MEEVHNVYDNTLPDEIPELQPYQEKIYFIKLDDESHRHVFVHTSSKVFRFKNTLSYWVAFLNNCNCNFEKVHRFKAINMSKLTGYGRDNATFGDWWVILETIRLTISKSFYNHLNKSEYRHLNQSIKLRKRP